jgi:ADP-ribose pyrophosphatase YjhB (NUDIX family)
MPRKTKIVGFSLPPQINNEVEEYLKKTHKTRSEFFREMIYSFFSGNTNIPTEKDLAIILKSYWDLKSSTKLEVIPIVLAIITDPDGNVVIGGRKEKDKWVENLSWVFPGGRLKSLDMEEEVKNIAKEETGLDVEVKQLVASRIHPDSGFKDIQIVALYFHCTVKNIKNTRPGGSLDCLEWVKPLKVFKYFTTSTCDEVTKFLTMIQKGK